jgi:hypothetical protein
VAHVSHEYPPCFAPRVWFSLSVSQRHDEVRCELRFDSGLGGISGGGSGIVAPPLPPLPRALEECTTHWGVVLDLLGAHCPACARPVAEPLSPVRLSRFCLRFILLLEYPVL